MRNGGTTRAGETDTYALIMHQGPSPAPVRWDGAALRANATILNLLLRAGARCVPLGPVEIITAMTLSLIADARRRFDQPHDAGAVPAHV